MMRLPLFAFRAPRTLEEAARILDGERANAMPLAGGTDLLPNMKRRQQVPRTLMSLRHIESLNRVALNDSGSRLGACLTLSEIAADPRFRNGLTALAQAASLVANPQHGHARRKHLSGHALQLLRSKLRVEKVDRFLPEKGRHDLLGRTGKLEVHGGVLDGHGPGFDGSWGASPSGVALRRTRSPSFRSLQ